MQRESYKLIAFDLDGTLVDSMGDFASVAADVMTHYFGWNREDSLKAYRETSGLPFRYQLEKIFPGHASISVAAEEYEDKKRLTYDSKSFFSDVEPALRRLREKGYLLGVSSNNHEENVTDKMKSCAGYFAEILGYRQGFFKGTDHFRYLNDKYGLRNDEILFVGDSINDGRVANKEGIDFVARLGTFHADEFSVVTPVVTVHDFGELCGWLGA